MRNLLTLLAVPCVAVAAYFGYKTLKLLMFSAYAADVTVALVCGAVATIGIVGLAVCVSGHEVSRRVQEQTELLTAQHDTLLRALADVLRGRPGL